LASPRTFVHAYKNKLNDQMLKKFAYEKLERIKQKGKGITP